MNKKIVNVFYDNKSLIIILSLVVFLTYGYFSLNTIVNIDGINDLILINKANDASTYISMGRWMWAIIVFLINYYPSGAFILLYNCIFFCASTILLCKVFNIKNLFYQILIGSFLVSFPINAYMFGYISWQYGLAPGIFFSIASLYYIKYNKNIWHTVLSVLFIATTVGIYQVFIPFIIILLLGLGICDIDKKSNNKNLLLKYVSYIGIFALGIIVYLLLSKLFLLLFSIKWNDYNGASSMPHFNIEQIIYYLPKYFIASFTFKELYFFPKYIQLLLTIICVVGFLLNYKGISKKCVPLYTIICIFSLLVPNILMLLQPLSWYHTLTLIPYLNLYLIYILLFIKNVDNNKIIKKVFNYTLIIIIFVFIIMDNKLAYMGKLSTNAAFSYINRMQMRIEQLDNYPGLSVNKKLYIIGQYDWGEFANNDAYIFDVGPTATFVYDNIAIENALNVLGDKYSLVNDSLDLATIKEIYKYSENFDVYPSNESVFMYEDIIVIKIK